MNGICKLSDNIILKQNNYLNSLFLIFDAFGILALDFNSLNPFSFFWILSIPISFSNSPKSCLFVELIYSSEIKEGDSISSLNTNLAITNFKKLISFVAIKNGEHNGIGYFAYDPEKIKKSIPSKIKLTEVRGIIENSVLS